GDKKRQREVQAESSRLKTELHQRQQKEIQELKAKESIEETNNFGESTSKDNVKFKKKHIVDQLYARLEATRIEEEENKKPNTPAINGIANKQRKPNRHKLRKLAKEQNEAAEEAKNQINMNEVESNAITELIKPMGLVVEEVMQ
ncbi:487_t:CDS:2, partial [Racocetra fulgida]